MSCQQKFKHCFVLQCERQGDGAPHWGGRAIARAESCQYFPQCHTPRAGQNDMTAAEEFIFCMVTLASVFVLLLFRGRTVVREINVPLCIFAKHTVSVSTISPFLSQVLILSVFHFSSSLFIFTFLSLLSNLYFSLNLSIPVSLCCVMPTPWVIGPESIPLRPVREILGKGKKEKERDKERVVESQGEGGMEEGKFLRQGRLLLTLKALE